MLPQLARPMERPRGGLRVGRASPSLLDHLRNISHGFVDNRKEREYRHSIDNSRLWTLRNASQVQGVACPASMQRDVWSIGDYKILDRLYVSGTSRVYLARCRISRRSVVIKAYIKSALEPLNHWQVHREIKIHASLQHANIVSLYGAFMDDDFYYLVQEYVEGGDLFDWLRTRSEVLSEHEAVGIVCSPLLAALSYLHSKGIVHRDVKPENLLLTSSKQLKLGDFGLAILQSERPVTRAGTLEYMAPEVLKNPSKTLAEENKNRAELIYDSKADSWAVTVLVYELMHGFPVFGRGGHPSYLKQRIMSSTPQFHPGIQELSEEACTFISTNLSKNPQDRMGVPDMLAHSWIVSNRNSPQKSARPPSPEPEEPLRRPLVNDLQGLTVHPPAKAQPSGCPSPADRLRHCKENTSSSAIGESLDQAERQLGHPLQDYLANVAFRSCPSIPTQAKPAKPRAPRRQHRGHSLD